MPVSSRKPVSKVSAMPTYQYRCTECGRDLEVVQKFSDASLTECPTCSGSLRKVFNAVGVVFKGSGFYRTDSRAANGNGSGSSSSDSGSDKGSGDKKSDSGDKSTEKKSDSTPAKTETKSGSDSGSGSKVPAGSSGSSSTGSKAASS
jgi:putative FmdB family regulatory protein